MANIVLALLLLAYLLVVPVANFFIGHVGTTCIPNGPCLIPVFPGVHAPSGVLVIGVGLVLRDLIQRSYGAIYSLFCIGVGTMLSVLVAPPSLVIASGLAFLLSELADFAVYTPLARRRFYWAVVLSCLAGSVVDSLLFLWVAFGSLDHLEGQVIGKIYAALTFVGWRLLVDFLGKNKAEVKLF